MSVFAKKNKYQTKHAFSLIETLVVAALFGLIMPILLTFLWRSFMFNRNSTGTIFNQQNARRAIDKMRVEIREATSGAGDQYPLAVCEGNSIEYYADVDQNDAVDKVRYYLDSYELKRTVTPPTGLTYLVQNAVTQTIMPNVLNNAGNPLFQYYNRTYTGVESPLALPVSCPEVRAVRIDVRLDTILEAQPGPFEVETVIQFRNLKNNF